MFASVLQTFLGMVMFMPLLAELQRLNKMMQGRDMYFGDLSHAIEGARSCLQHALRGTFPGFCRLELIYYTVLPFAGVISDLHRLYINPVTRFTCNPHGPWELLHAVLGGLRQTRQASEWEEAGSGGGDERRRPQARVQQPALAAVLECIVCRQRRMELLSSCWCRLLRGGEAVEPQERSAAPLQGQSAHPALECTSGTDAARLQLRLCGHRCDCHSAGGCVCGLCVGL